MQDVADLFGESLPETLGQQDYIWVDGLKYYEPSALKSEGTCGPRGLCTYEYLTGQEGLERVIALLNTATKRKAIFAFDFETSPRKQAPVDTNTGAFDLSQLSWSVRNKENGSEPHSSIIFLLSLSFQKNHSVVIDVREMRKCPTFISALSEAMLRAKPIAHNFSFDWRFMKALTGINSVVYFDSMIGTQLLYAGLPNPHVPWIDPDKERPKISRKYGPFPSGIALGSVIRENMGYQIDKKLQAEFLDIHPNSGMTDDLVAYAAGDTALLIELTQILRKRLEYKGLWKVWQEFEAPFLPILADTQYQGITIDVTETIRLWEKAKKECQELETLWNSKVPGVTVSNNTALLAWIQKKYPQYNVKSVAADILDEIGKFEKDEELRILLDYRTVAKVESTYLSAWIEKERNPLTGRIHPDAQQAATDTSRCSYSSPNVQNIPSKGDWVCVRDCFVARHGYVLIDSDFSQFEIRALADLSGEDGMMEFFRRLDKAQARLDQYLEENPELARIVKHNQVHKKDNQLEVSNNTYLKLKSEVDKNDFHTLNAAALFKETFTKGTEKEQKELRAKAKSLSFGIPYGIGAAKVARNFKIPKEEGQALIDAFYKAWPKVKAFLESTKRDAKYRKEITARTGRKRFFYVPEIFRTKTTEKFRDPYEGHWAACQREAANWPLQQINGDVLKKACILLQPYLKKYDARIVLLVHDEILAEAPEENADTVMELMQQCMKQAALDCGITTCPIDTSGIWHSSWVH